MNAELSMSPGNGQLVPPLGEDDLIPLYANLQNLSAGTAEMRTSILAFQSDQMSNAFFNGYQQQQFAERKNNLIMNVCNLLRQYGGIQDQLIGALKVWQRKQALAGNGAPFNSNLDGIQFIVEALLDRISEITLFVNNLIHMLNEPILNEYLEHAQKLHNILIVSTFIVEKQPPQVKKKATKKISATVRWLIGDKLGIHLSKPVVKCEILSEALAKRLTTENIKTPPECSGKMTGNECTMEFDGNNRNFSATFSNLMISEVDRFERKGSENVTDRKHTLLFYTSTTFQGFSINCWAISVPLVVVVHDNQAPLAWATILWDNAFSVIEREPFKVPDRVHYTALLEALNMRFGSYTGRQLTEDNLKIICNKLIVNEAGQTNDYISFTQFCKDKMPNFIFPFWEWFYDIMKLTKKYLQQTWTDGHIVGFISKRETKEILTHKANGTFLLRFSDSTRGGITIAYRDYYGDIKILAPWTTTNLQIRSLADSIRDLDFLRVIYPTMVPSEVAFCSSPPTQKGNSKDGYVGHGIKVQIITPPLDHQISGAQQNSDTTMADSNVSLQNVHSFPTEQFENGFDFFASQNLNWSEWKDWGNSESPTSGDDFS